MISSTALNLAKKRVRGKRIIDPTKNIPRKIKRTLNKITPFCFSTMINGSHPLDEYLKLNASKGIKETIFKRLEKTARKWNVTIPENFGCLPKIPKLELLDALQTTGNYSLFLQAINIGELNDLVKQRNITALIPADVPFQEYLEKELQTTPENFFTDKEKVRSLVKQHILPGYITARKFKRLANTQLSSFEEGKEIRLSEDTDDDDKPIYKFKNANILQTDWKIENGLIHVVDRLFV